MSGRNNAGVYQALQSERAVVGAILSGCLAFRDVDLVQSDFTDIHASQVFQTMAMLDAQDKPCDLTAVSDALPRLELSILVDMMKDTPIISAANAQSYVAAIKSASMRRALSKVAQKTVALAGSSDADPIDTAEEIRKQIDELLKNGPTEDVMHLQEIVMQMHEWLFAGDQGDAISTGISTLDAVLGGGIRGSKLCIIGARPSVGKSALGLYIAENAARAGKQVLIVSLEMDESEIYSRILARYALTDVDIIEARRFTDEQQIRIVEAYGEMSAMNLSVSTRASTPGQIRSIALKMRAQRGLDLIVVDYLQLLTSGQKTSNRTEEVGSISRQLKLLAMELHVPVIAMSQMNRQSEAGMSEGGRMPKMSESRESGSIENDANQFIILHPPAENALPHGHEQMYESCQINGWTFMHVAVAKNRNGKKGIVPVAFDAPHMRFIPFDRR